MIRFCFDRLLLNNTYHVSTVRIIDFRRLATLLMQNFTHVLLLLFGESEETYFGTDEWFQLEICDLQWKKREKYLPSV